MKFSYDRSRKGSPSERGALLVESSLALVLLVLIAAGILEYAGLFSSTGETSWSLRSGAKVGSTTTNGSPSDDYGILQAVVQRAGSKRPDFTKVIIYRADAASAKPPAACISGATSSANKCNVYLPVDLSKDQGALNSSAAAQGWTYTSRLSGEYVGVWVSVSRPKLVGLVPAPTNYTDSFTMQIEPPTAFVAGSNWGTGNTGTALPWADNWFCWGSGCYEGHASDYSTGGAGGTGT